jgi:hypothetical protein
MTGSFNESIRKKTFKKGSLYIITDPFIQVDLENAGIPVIYNLLEYNLTCYI